MIMVCPHCSSVYGW